MTKKKLNTDAITSELSGASAFFTRRTPLLAEESPTTPSVQPSATPAAQQPPLPQATPNTRTQETLPDNKATQPENKPTSKQTSNIASNITILQLLGEEDIEDLREPAYQAQTFRLREQEIEWMKDTAYRLSKEMKRKKVSQADILRISFKLFDRLLATHKEELLTILERIK